jgi:pyruvate carboxylase subunit B
MEPISWGKIHPDVISVQAMLEDEGFIVPKINMKAYMKARAMTQAFIDDFLGYFMDQTNKYMSSLLLKSGLPGGMMGSMMADLKGARSGINMILKAKNEPELNIDDLLIMLFDEVEYVWPKLGYPPLVTPFSQYVKNVALMNVMALAKGEERWSMIDRHTWDMILGKSGKLPGPLAPEIVELAKTNGYEFPDADPQENYPDQLDEYRKEMIENNWDSGEDDEELFELAMHDRQYRDYKSGVAKKRFEEELQRAKDAALVGKGYSEEEIRKYKRAKAEPIVAFEKGRVIWEIDVEAPSMPPEVGHKYYENDTFCYIATPWSTYDKVSANFTGRIIEVCAKQGALVNKGDVLAYIERSHDVA